MENVEHKEQEFWDYVIDKHEKGGILAGRVYNWLNYDNLEAIILDRGVFWIELVCSTSTLPEYAIKYIKQWAKEQGWQYLYDLKVK